MGSMAHLSLYRKYRPQTFPEILGQEHVSTTLANAINEDRVSHAYLFTGPRGTGKTSTARILAKALNCEQGPTPEPCGKCMSCVSIQEGSSLDVIEMDAASHSKVDDARDVLAGVSLATAGGRRKVYVIDEVHMLSTSAFNALLKTLEEPPSHVVFVLATTEAHNVLPTIVSRTQRFDFRRVSADVLQTHLSHVAKSEGIEIDGEAIGAVARHAEGSVRDALSALDQLASFGGPVGAEDAESLLGNRDEDALIEIFDAIADEDVGAIFRSMQSVVARGADMRQLAIDALEHSRSLLLLKSAPEADSLLDVAPEDRVSLATQADRFSGGALLRTLDLIGKALVEMRNAPNHRLLLEVALIRSAAPDTDPSANGLLGRIERLERRIGIEAAPSAEAPAQTPAKSPPRAAPKSQKAPSKAPPKAAAPQEPPKAKAQRPAESTEPEVTTPAPAQTSDHVGLVHIKDAWPATLKEVGQRSKRVGAFLNPSRPIRFEDGVLAVEVASSWHKETMEESSNSKVLAEALHAALGVKAQVTFAERSGDGDTEAKVEAETSIPDYAEARSVDESEHDPVELVKKQFGAQVVEERA